MTDPENLPPLYDTPKDYVPPPQVDWEREMRWLLTRVRQVVSSTATPMTRLEYLDELLREYKA